MSIPLVAAVTAAVALNATTTTVEPVNVVAAPRYDPCATTQLINSAPIARPVHRPKHHAAPHRKIAAVAKVAVVKAPAAKPRLIKAHNPHKRLKRKRPIPEAYTQQTCAAPTGGIAPLDFASLMQPTAYLPALPEGARAVDVAATTPAALGDSDTPAAGNLAPFNDDPFVLGPGGLGRGGGSPAGGGGGGGAGGGSAPGGGGSGGSGPGGGSSGGGSTPPTPTPPNPGTPGGSGAPTGSTPISAVPEPASWMSMLTGFAILGGMMRGRRAAALAGRRKA